MARLAFPSMSSLMLDVLKARGIDKKTRHRSGDRVSNSAVSVYYASIASGEAELIVGGPHVLPEDDAWKAFPSRSPRPGRRLNIARPSSLATLRSIPSPISRVRRLPRIWGRPNIKSRPSTAASQGVVFGQGRDRGPGGAAAWRAPSSRPSAWTPP